MIPDQSSIPQVVICSMKRELNPDQRAALTSIIQNFINDKGLTEQVVFEINDKDIHFDVDPSYKMIDQISQDMSRLRILADVFPESITPGFRYCNPSPCTDGRNNAGIGCENCIVMTLPLLDYIRDEIDVETLLREMRRHHSGRQKLFAPIDRIELEYELFMLYVLYVYRRIVLAISGDSFKILTKRGNLKKLGFKNQRFRDEYDSSPKSKTDQIHLVQQIRKECIEM